MSVYSKENPLYLEAALVSIYHQQTQKPDEILLVEDGPLTDHLYSTISQMALQIPVLKRLVLKDNMGLGYALARGVEAIENDIILRMDTDDIAYKNRIELQTKLLIEEDFDVVGACITEFEKSPDIINAVKFVPEKSWDIYKYSKLRNPVNHMTAAFKKSSVLAAGNYQDMPYFEDYYLWMRMIIAGRKFYNVQSPLVNVRFDQNAILRRRGSSYSHYEKNFYKTLKRESLLEIHYILLSLLIRKTCRLLPFKHLAKFYHHFLRKPSNRWQ